MTSSSMTRRTPKNWEYDKMQFSSSAGHGRRTATSWAFRSSRSRWRQREAAEPLTAPPTRLPCPPARGVFSGIHDGIRRDFCRQSFLPPLLPLLVNAVVYMAQTLQPFFDSSVCASEALLDVKYLGEDGVICCWRLVLFQPLVLVPPFDPGQGSPTVESFLLCVDLVVTSVDSTKKPSRARAGSLLRRLSA